MVERRSVSELDEPFLRQLHATTRPEVAGWPEAQRDAFLDLQYRAQRQGWQAQFPDSEHELILLGGNPIGRIWVAWAADECQIVHLALLPEHRRSGFGTRIVEDVLGRADANGVPVRISVHQDNGPALAFWQRLGFATVGADEVYLSLERPVRAAHPPRASLAPSR